MKRNALVTVGTLSEPAALYTRVLQSIVQYKRVSGAKGDLEVRNFPRERGKATARELFKAGKEDDDTGTQKRILHGITTTQAAIPNRLHRYTRVGGEEGH